MRMSSYRTGMRCRGCPTSLDNERHSPVLRCPDARQLSALPALAVSRPPPAPLRSQHIEKPSQTQVAASTPTPPTNPSCLSDSTSEQGHLGLSLRVWTWVRDAETEWLGETVNASRTWNWQHASVVRHLSQYIAGSLLYGLWLSMPFFTAIGAE